MNKSVERAAANLKSLFTSLSLISSDVLKSGALSEVSGVSLSWTAQTHSPEQQQNSENMKKNKSLRWSYGEQ